MNEGCTSSFVQVSVFLTSEENGQKKGIKSLKKKFRKFFKNFRNFFQKLQEVFFGLTGCGKWSYKFRTLSATVIPIFGCFSVKEQKFFYFLGIRSVQTPFSVFTEIIPSGLQSGKNIFC